MVFDTLDALVTYYSVYVRFDTNDETAEVFPLKHRIRERKSAREAESSREEKSPCDVESTREENDEAESKSKRKREKRKKKQSKIYY
uniref:Uncharacterized protein n=1 Tax=Panagrolaimus davidi TaxID=227884 RepID=A0A914PPK6_9BILA